MPEYTISAKINSRIIRYRGMEYVSLFAVQQMLIDLQNQLCNNDASADARKVVSTIIEVLTRDSA